MLISQPHTTKLLAHGAMRVRFVSCRPIGELAQRTNDAADAT